jgi:hypothetical protein
VTITYHDQFEQGSQQWLDARCGLLTASEMKLIVTPTLKAASNDKERAHLYELLAQRITRYVEPHYISDDMLRGHVEEVTARELYTERYAPVREVGFVTNDRWGFTLGCSPDGIVGDAGLIECKSRRQKFQVQTIVECIGTEHCPSDFMIQVQTALLVTEREWCDFISYSGGLPMAVVRVHPDDAVQGAIIEASAAFEARLADKLARFTELAADLIPTERTVEQEMFV